MQTRLAILIDGDNVSAAFHARILAQAGAQTRSHSKPPACPTVFRVYGDATHPSGWLTQPGFRFCHAGAGKNGADILLSIEAMELALTGGITHFLIASSDGDFSHIALRLRELGCHVTGVGEAKTPLSFREACNDFVPLTLPASLAPAKPCAKTLTMDQKIKQIIEANGPQETGVRVVELGQAMYGRHGVKISQSAERTWRGYLSARPDMFDLDCKGPDARVRCR